MKICPACLKSFKQRKKEACPNCNEPLVIKKGVVYKKSDQQLATRLIALVEDLYKVRDSLQINMRTNTEYAAAYYIIDQIRKVDSDDVLVIMTVKRMLRSDFWFRSVNSLHMLKTHVNREAQILNKELKIKAQEKLVRKTRLQDVFQGKEYVEFSAPI